VRPAASNQDGPGSPEVRVHRALASQARARLVEVLRREPDLDAATIGARLGLHVNTVRAHLGVLEDAGLVHSVTEGRGRPGRPRLLYRAAEEEATASALTDDRGYRFLAAVLASYLGATEPDSAAAAERAGMAWGRFVIEKPAPYSTLDPADAVERLVAMLQEFGFAPEVEEELPGAPRVVLHRCPFLEVAREHQEVVCSVHLGLMRGALDELGVGVGVEDLIPWARPDACVSNLRVAVA
jgi:predicted ArsR family transcriptional regulator